MSMLTRLYAENDVELRPRETYLFKVLWLIHVSLSYGTLLVLVHYLASCFLIHANLTPNPACFITVIYLLLIDSITTVLL